MAANTPPSPTEQFVFERIKEQYDFENEDSIHIDSAATNLVGWNGLVISVLLTGGGLLITRGTEIKLSSVEAYILSLTLSFLLTSLVLGIIGFRKGGYDTVPEASYLLTLAANSTASRILRETTGTMIAATQNNRRRNTNRKNTVWASQILFVVAMGFGVMFLVLQIGTLTG
jgi:hypothetical protein